MIGTFALILAAAAPLAAEAPESAGSWLRAIPGIGGGCCRALAVDAGGDARYLGLLSASGSIDGIAVEARGEGDLLLARFTADGRCAWAKVAGGAGRDVPVTLDVAADGSTFLAGLMEADARFDSRVLPSLGSVESFLARYSADGRCEWAQKLPGRGEEGVRDLAVDRTGAALVAGTHVRQFAKGDVPEIYVAKFARDGTRTWLRRAEGTARSVALAVDEAGVVYLAGSSPARGSTAARVPEDGWPLVLAFDARGASLWRWEPERRASQEGEEPARGRAVAVAAIPGGGCWVLGEIRGRRAVDGRSPGTSDRNIFLARLLSDGTLDWMVHMGGPGEDHGFDVSALPGGRCAISGSFRRTARFEPWEVSAAGSAIFAVVYDSDGNCLFVERGAEPGDDSGEPSCAAISGSSDGAIWMSGAFRERFALHDREITAEDAGIFLARLAPDDDS